MCLAESSSNTSYNAFVWFENNTRAGGTVIEGIKNGIHTRSEFRTAGNGIANNIPFHLEICEEREKFFNDVQCFPRRMR